METTRQKILKSLALSPRPLACHEFFVGANDAAVSARLRELARDGLVIGQRVPGKAYKVWNLCQP